MTWLLVCLYVVCFQACAIPSIVRIRRRGRSGDLSTWRECLLLIGTSAQFAVMLQTHAAWQVCISPVLSFSSVTILLLHIWWYR